MFSLLFRAFVNSVCLPGETYKDITKPSQAYYAQVNKVKNPRGGVGFPFLRGAVNFSNQSFRLQQSLVLTVPFFH